MKTSGNLALAYEMPAATLTDSDVGAEVSDLMATLSEPRVTMFLTKSDGDSSVSQPTGPSVETWNLAPAEGPAVQLGLKLERQDYSRSLQKWEGVVVDVKDDCFVARLIDLTRKGLDDEAEFPIEEVSHEDRSLVEPGAIFYWNIGYTDSRSGQRTRTSLVRFRRLPVWTDQELQAAASEAERIRESLGWK